jgi:hypothetical protein
MNLRGTYVRLAIRPSVLSLPMHLVLHPVAFIRSLVGPNVYTDTLDFFVAEFALVPRTIVPKVMALALLVAHVVIAHVLSAVLPRLTPLAMLKWR